jgi:hypothetical protein
MSALSRKRISAGRWAMSVKCQKQKSATYSAAGLRPWPCSVAFKNSRLASAIHAAQLQQCKLGPPEF